MADYYTNFSFIVSLPNAEQQTQALDLYQKMSAWSRGDEIPADLPPALQDTAEDCSFEVEPDGASNLWVHSMSGGIDAVCAYVQHLLQQFNLPPVSFEWSHDCSKPRTDAYGGGAALIQANEIQTMNTADWLRSMEI